MTRKPTYEDLEQRIIALEEESIKGKRLDEVLRVSEQRMRLALEGTDQGLWGFDLLTKKVSYSDNWHKILGYGLEESQFDYEWYINQIHPESRPVFEKALLDYMSGHTKYLEWEYQIRNKSGEWQWIHALGIFTETDKTGFPVRMIGTHRNITARKKAEEALRESEEKHKSLTENMNDILWTTDLEMNITYLSPSIEKVLGYTVEERMKHTLAEQMPPETLQLATDMLAEELQGDEERDPDRHISLELDFFHKDGSVRCMETSLSFIRNESGKPVGIHGLARDITDHKLAEELLRESKERYKRLMEDAPIGFCLVDPSGNILYINKKCEEVSGYSREELVGLNGFKNGFFPAASVRILTDRLMLRLAGGTPRPDAIELQVVCKDGRKIWIEMFTTINFVNKVPVGVQLAMIDITERKKAEEALRDSEVRYRKLFNNHAAVKLLIDPDTGCIIDANEAAVNYYGWSHERLKQMKIQEINTLSPEDVEMELENARTNIRVSFEFCHRRADGSIRDVEVFSSKIEVEGKDILHSVIHDITDRNRAEEERKRLEEQLKQAQKLEAIGTLAGGIAHDFNNLLMGIQGYASLMLLDMDISHPHYERMKRIEQQVQSGADLTKQLLGFARSGRYEVKPTDMNDIINKTSSMFGRTKKEISIHRKYGKDLWSVEVDRGQMEQVFMNLYVNAWQAMSGGGEIYLETENILLDDEQAFPYTIKPGQYVKITVTDTGTGMDEKTRERIFDPFFTTKEMGRGTGLGLATVYGIIKGHKGMINVDSEPGQGTTFTIYLPASEKGVVKERTAAGTIARGMETILLVDDEQMVLKVTRELLESLGYRVYAAGSGQEAIAVYMEKRDEIDLMILDMIMPGISGGETFDRLREIKPDAKVLLSSGYSIEGEAQLILERGCNGFIQKPFQLEHLSRKVREMLG